MHFKEGDWDVDITPDFALGLYFPHVRISQRSTDGSLVTVYDSGHLNPFETAEEAFCVAEQSVAQWIFRHPRKEPGADKSGAAGEAA